MVCERAPFEVEDGDACFAGLDLSASRDLTAFVLVFPKNGLFHVLPQVLVPEDGLTDKAKTEKSRGIYGQTGIPDADQGPVIKPEVIATAIAEAAEI